MGEMAEALWYVAPGRAELRKVELPPLEEGWVEVETRFSALSRGTERLVLNGQVPSSEYARMRAPMQDGDFPFPVKYGYACSGRVIAGPTDLVGRDVFSLHPHQDRFRLPEQSVIPIPVEVPAARGILAANMETALNAVWDAHITPGSEVAVIGLGLLGCLIATVLSRQTDLTVRGCDIQHSRFDVLRDYDVTCLSPEEMPDTNITVFHTSASSAGLRTSLEALAFEGEVIEASWYGNREVAAPLGGAFHSRRLSIRATQVGAVAKDRRASTTHRDRLGRALALLDDPRLDVFVTGEVPFRDLPEALPYLLDENVKGIATRIRYR